MHVVVSNIWWNMNTNSYRNECKKTCFSNLMDQNCEVPGFKLNIMLYLKTACLLLDMLQTPVAASNRMHYQMVSYWLYFVAGTWLHYSYSVSLTLWPNTV